MITVTILSSFEACHHLPFYEGKCHNLHGHSYKLEVTVGGVVETDKINPKVGMIMDFHDLKEIVEKVSGKYDHADLNDYFDNPTAEIMVATIARDLILELTPFRKEGKPVWLESVKLWESATSYAMWSNPGESDKNMANFIEGQQKLLRNDVR